MCNLLNDNSKLLFGKQASDNLAPERKFGTGSAITGRKRSFLELGSGIGRAGIMAAKLMSLYDTFDSCVLTDGNIISSL
jgi:hypothetical protein